MREVGVIGRLPGRRSAVATAINHNATLIDCDEVVWIIGTAVRGIARTERSCGISRPGAVRGKFLIWDLEGRRFKSGGESEHVLEFPLLERGGLIGILVPRDQKLCLPAYPQGSQQRKS